MRTFLPLQALAAVMVATYGNAQSCGGGTTPSEPVVANADTHMMSKSLLANPSFDGHWAPASVDCILGGAGGVFIEKDTKRMLVPTNIPGDFDAAGWYTFFGDATLEYQPGIETICTLATEDLSDGECEGADGWCISTVTVEKVKVLTINGVAL